MSPAPYTPDDWAQASVQVRAGPDERAWQAYMAGVYRAIIDRWARGAPAGPALKTDLFEEATGQYTLLRDLEASGHPVIAMDWTPAIVHAARQNHPAPPAKAVVCDVRALPFASATFAVVLSNSTLDHFASEGDIFRSLAELSHVLRPGGILILALDNPANFFICLRNRLPFRWLRRAGVIPYFMGSTLSAEGARAALSEAGLVVTDQTAIVHAPRLPAIWLARLVAPHRKLSALLRRILALCERAERWPTHNFTGYYVALRAKRP